MKKRIVLFAISAVLLSGCYAFGVWQGKADPFKEKSAKDISKDFDKSLRFIFVKDTELDGLQLKVNLLMKDGYYPVGGVTIETLAGGARRYIIAMVLEEFPGG